MRTLISIKLTLLFAVVMSSLSAQQTGLFTHYQHNSIAINPAYAGSRDLLTVNAIHRSQWVGFGDGAPVSQTITAHTPIFSDAFGLGLSLFNDKFGPTSTTDIVLDLAYRLKLNTKYSLSFGLKGGGAFYTSNIAGLGVDDDQALQENINTRFLPNVGVGLYLSQEKFYLGASAPKLFSNEIVQKQSNITVGNTVQTFYFIAGALVPITTKWDFKPTTFLKVTKEAAQADITATFIANKKLNLGLNFRTSDGIGAIVGYQFTKQLLVSYAYDWSAFSVSQNSNGSHEVMLRYDFNFSNGNSRIESPRNF